MSSGRNASLPQSHSWQIARYLGGDVSPLIAFGSGLSCSSSEIKNLRLTKKQISVNGATQILVDATNTGKRAGAETVQRSRICNRRF